MGEEGFVRGPLGGWTQVATSDGRTIAVELTKGQLTVVVGDDGSRASVPYPSAGFGGHELLLSKNETYLVMWLYSGQSQVGYELFQFRPSLRHLSSFPYVVGQGFGPAFSTDERQLALAWATNSGLYTDEQELDDNGRTVTDCVVEWAEIHVQGLPDGAASRCRIDARIPRGFPAEGDDDYYPSALVCFNGHLDLQSEWGESVQVPIPLPASLMIQGPMERKTC